MIDALKIPAAEWKSRFSESAHRAVFRTIKPASWDRIDYAWLLVRRDPGEVLCYVTVRETDHETVYWQFGGALPPAKGTTAVYRAFCTALSAQKKRSKRVTMLIENTNTPMLKLAAKAGFLICGVRYYQGTVLVEHLLEFG